jgi:hypothetical protein
MTRDEGDWGPLRALAVTLEKRWLLLGLLLPGCGLVLGEPGVGGESHFLGGCAQGCSDGLSCLGGVCSRVCSYAPGECGDLAASASCRQNSSVSIDPFCDLPCTDDESCAREGSGLACQSGVCRTALHTSSGGQPGIGPDRSSPWWCLGQVPPPLPPPRSGVFSTLAVSFVLPVVDWTTRAPLAGRGLRATLCSTLDSLCQTPLAPPYLVPDATAGSALPPGAAAIPVPEGFDGFIKFDVLPTSDNPTDQQFLPVAQYLGGILSGDITQGPPVLMVPRPTLNAIVQQSFPGVDPGVVSSNGIVEVGVYDCNGGSVTDARIELEVNGQAVPGVVPFQLPASRIPIAQASDRPLYTSPNGWVGYLNVAPGVVRVLAYRGDETEPFAETQLGAVAGQISQGLIRPAYFQDASIPGSASAPTP